MCGLKGGDVPLGFSPHSGPATGTTYPLIFTCAVSGNFSAVTQCSLVKTVNVLGPPPRPRREQVPISREEAEVQMQDVTWLDCFLSMDDQPVRPSHEDVTRDLLNGLSPSQRRPLET
jgi:hypothetical protein